MGSVQHQCNLFCVLGARWNDWDNNMLFIVCSKECTFLTLRTRGLVLLSENMFDLLYFWNFKRLFHELMNQYQTCLYLTECIFHCGFKYGYEIPRFGFFFKHFVNLFTCRLHSPAAWKALTFTMRRAWAENKSKNVLKWSQKKWNFMTIFGTTVRNTLK